MYPNPYRAMESKFVGFQHHGAVYRRILNFELIQMRTFHNLSGSWHAFRSAFDLFFVKARIVSSSTYLNLVSTKKVKLIGIASYYASTSSLIQIVSHSQELLVFYQDAAGRNGVSNALQPTYRIFHTF